MLPAGVISKFGEASPDRLLEGVAKGGVGVAIAWGGNGVTEGAREGIR